MEALNHIPSYNSLGFLFAMLHYLVGCIHWFNNTLTKSSKWTLQRCKVFAESEGDMHNANCKHKLKITKPKTLALTMLIVYVILKGYMLSFGRCPLELLLLVWVQLQIFKIIKVLVMRRGQVPISWNAWVGGEARF